MAMIKNILILVAVLFSCQENGDDKQNPSFIGDWTVFSLSTFKKEYQNLDSLKLAIKFRVDNEAEIGGVCNGGMASYTIDSDTNLKFASIELTERACASVELNDLEEDLVNVLYEITQWSVIDDTLRLFSSNDQELLLSRK